MVPLVAAFLNSSVGQIMVAAYQEQKDKEKKNILTRRWWPLEMSLSEGP